MNNPLKLLRTEAEREKMRAACRFNTELMNFIRPYVREGITTNEIDKFVHAYTVEHGHVPACLGYKGYPKSCCTSINEVVCHGIPDYKPLKSGDIINIDLTSIVDGYYGDQSETFLVGEVSEEAAKLVQVTKECLELGIQAVRPGGLLNEIGRAIEEHAHANMFSVVRSYCGHGIGTEFHQYPMIPHYFESRDKRVAVPGMCFTIEPMINFGLNSTQLDEQDGWTVRTKDRQLSAQFEHTLLVTEGGVEILTAA